MLRYGQPAAWSAYWQLIQFPHQAFLVSRVASNPVGLKTNPIKRQMNLLVGSTAILTQWRASAIVWPGERERWLPQDLLVEDILCLKEYLSSFQPRHVVGAGHVLSNPMAIIRHWYDGKDDDVYLHKCMFVSLKRE